MPSVWKQIWDEVRRPFKRPIDNLKENGVAIVLEGLGRYFVAREVRDKLREYRNKWQGSVAEAKRLGKMIFELQSMLARAESYMRDQGLSDEQIGEVLAGDVLPEEELAEPETF